MVLSDREVRLRKPAKCFGCWNVQTPGTKVHRVASKDYGDFTSTVWCLVCVEYMGRHMEDGDGCGPGELKSEDPEGWEAIRVEIADAIATKESTNTPA